MQDERVTIDPYGLDEIVLTNVDVHVERMDKGHIWMAFYRHGDPNLKRIAVGLQIRGAVIEGAVLENEFGIEVADKV